MHTSRLETVHTQFKLLPPDVALGDGVGPQMNKFEQISRSPPDVTSRLVGP